MRWTRLAAILLVWTLTGCAGLGPVRPPLALIPAERPEILDDERRLTIEGLAWLGILVRSYRENCVVLSVLRGEDVKQCDRGLR